MICIGVSDLCCWLLRYCYTKKESESAKNPPEYDYYFDDMGVIASSTSGKEFVYDVFNADKIRNQARYEAISESVENQIYEMMENQGLERIYVPKDASAGESRGFFFATPDAWTTKKPICILINGAPPVHAGQWSRRLIFNVGLEAGSQLPYIHKALSRGMAVVVLNTNLNMVENEQNQREYIRGSETDSNHAKYVWQNFISHSVTPRIIIIAHSRGGSITLSLANAFETDFVSRVFAVCLTDSAHATPIDERVNSKWWKHLCEVSVDWVCSRRPTGAREKARGLPCVSAGTAVHEESSWRSIDSIFFVIDQKLQDATAE